MEYVPNELLSRLSMCSSMTRNSDKKVIWVAMTRKKEQNYSSTDT
jgi:hypothetical protein